MRRVLAGLLMAAALSWPVVAAAQAGEDTVMLTAGGRVRGTIIEEDRTKGVRVKLADGTIKSIPAKDVKAVQYAGAAEKPLGAPDAPPAPPPAAPAPPMAPPGAVPMTPGPAEGSIRVESPFPGRVFINGAEVGDAPVDVKRAAVGQHQVRIDFQSGGSDQRIILVQAGETARVVMTPPAPITRGGFSMGVTGEFNFTPFFDGFFLMGATAGMAMNIGISELLDLRMVPFVSFGHFTDFDVSFITPGAYTAIQFNLGSVYALHVGFQGGIVIPVGQFRGPSSVAGLIGPEWSVATFRLGAKKQFEVGVRQSLNIYIAGGAGTALQNGITFTWLSI